MEDTRELKVKMEAAVSQAPRRFTTRETKRRRYVAVETEVEPYLGNLIAITGGAQEDVEVSCRKTQVFFCILRPAWGSKCMSLRTKPRIINSNIKSLFLYRPKRTLLPNLRSSRLRYILGVWWTKRISKEDLGQFTNQDSASREENGKGLANPWQKPVTTTIR